MDFSYSNRLNNVIYLFIKIHVFILQFYNSVKQYANSKNEMDEEIKVLTEKVNYLDQLVLTKDQEREQIMLSYKKLINEHEKLDVTYKYSTEENNNARQVRPK